MKKLIILLFSVCISQYLSSQNTFPLPSGNVGIGTTSPLVPFHVKANASGNNSYFTTGDHNSATNTGSSFVLDFGAATGNTYTRLSAVSGGNSAWNNLILQSGGGSIGIGTTSPGTNKLAIDGVAANAYGLYVQGNATTSASIGALISAGTNSDDLSLAVRNAANSSSYLYIRGDGKIGMGTTSPSEKLSVVGNIAAQGNIAVNGNLIAKKVVVTQTAGVTMYLISIISCEVFLRFKNLSATTIIYRMCHLQNKWKKKGSIWVITRPCS